MYPSKAVLMGFERSRGHVSSNDHPLSLHKLTVKGGRTDCPHAGVVEPDSGASDVVKTPAGHGPSQDCHDQGHASGHLPPHIASSVYDSANCHHMT